MVPGYDPDEPRAFMAAQLPTNSLKELSRTSQAVKYINRPDLAAAWNQESRTSHPSLVSQRADAMKRTPRRWRCCTNPSRWAT